MKSSNGSPCYTPQACPEHHQAHQPIQRTRPGPDQRQIDRTNCGNEITIIGNELIVGYLRVLYHHSIIIIDVYIYYVYGICIYIYVYMCVCVHMICRNVHVHMYMYIYNVFIYIYIHVYIYIRIHI